MKKAAHRILTAILAACLLLGGTLCVSAAAKTFGAVITIRKMPTDTTFIPGITEPDLSGLELAFKLGGVERTLRYNDMDAESNDPDDYYGIWLSDPEDGELKIGKNTFTLSVDVNKGKENYTRSGLPITFTGVPLFKKVDLTQVPALKAGLPNKVQPVAVYSSDLHFYSFTPKVDGWYSFRSSFSSRLRFPSSEEVAGSLSVYSFLNPSSLTDLFRAQIDPIGKLFDEQGTLVAEGDDHEILFGLRNSLDFSFTVQLEGGKTYYFLPGYYGAEEPYLVTPLFLAFAF
jgi:hypothetical protein